MIIWNGGEREIKKNRTTNLLSLPQGVGITEHKTFRLLVRFFSREIRSFTYMHSDSWLFILRLRFEMGRCFDALHSIIRLCWYTVAIKRLCRRLGQNSPPKTVPWCSSKQHWADHKRNFKMSNESGLSRYRLLGWDGSSLPRFCNQFNFQDNSFLLKHRYWKSFYALID